MYKYCKLLIKIYPLALTIYGLYQTTEKVSFLALLLICFMMIGWILQIVFEVFGAIFTNRFALIMDGVKADVEEIKRPVTAVGNFFKKITGKEVETPQEPTKNQLKLREKVEQFRAERKEKRELKKQEYKAKKAAEKQEKIDKKAAISIENKLLKSAEKQEKAALKQEKTFKRKEKTAKTQEKLAKNAELSAPQAGRYKRVSRPRRSRQGNRRAGRKRKQNRRRKTRKEIQEKNNVIVNNNVIVKNQPPAP